jgi:hypothetical protein
MVHDANHAPKLFASLYFVNHCVSRTHNRFAFVVSDEFINLVWQRLFVWTDKSSKYFSNALRGIGSLCLAFSGVHFQFDLASFRCFQFSSGFRNYAPLLYYFPAIISIIGTVIMPCFLAISA